MFGMGAARAGSSGANAKKAARAAKPELVAVNVKLEPRHREKLRLLGGDAWLREQLEKAKLESGAGG